MDLTALFDEAIERKASDIHLSAGEIPRLRISGELVAIDHPLLTREAILGLLGPMLSQESRVRLESGLTVERSVLHRDISFGVVAFRIGDDGLVATFRLLSNDIAALDFVAGDALPLFERIRDARRGFVLITGPAVSGKWTVACSLIEAINQTVSGRIFVIAGQPNYHYVSKKAMVTQFYVGQDCDSYVRALELCLRSDLDYVAIDDIPTPETLRQALILSETGHLVIATMHATGVGDALKRLLDAAGAEAPALRQALAQNLVAVTSQLLFKRDGKPGRIAAYEYLAANASSQAAIASGDLRVIEHMLASDPDCRSMGQALVRLAAAGEISSETAAANQSSR